jgi:AraC-like DNA-binding protein
MSYCHAALAAAVIKSLQADPQTNLKQLTTDLGVDRHTITRVLQEALGLTFRRLRDRYQSTAIRHALRQGQTKSIKVIATETGYGCGSSLARSTRRSYGMTPTALRSRN